MLEVKDVSYRYDQDLVLDTINLEINAGEIICLLGESGSGKTTLLRAIAGLEAGYSGIITIKGTDLAHMPVHQRGFGLMFQDFALFPHMTVAQNVAFGLRMKGISQTDQQRIVSDMLELVGLSGYNNRSIDALSGGQKQRVALARSLAPQPKLLMLDEPLGSLDAGLREHLVGELRQIIKQIGLTAIYVTHDQQEAYAIADRIALMNNGRIEQYDSPETVYHQPVSEFVARFLGLTNIVPASFVETYDDHATSLLLHPNALNMTRSSSRSGKIIERTFQGDFYKLTVKIDNHNLTMRVSSDQDVPEIGQSIAISIDEKAIHPLYS